MNKILLLFIIALCFASCLNHKDITNTVYCQVDSEISEFPDSSFFSDITCMYHYKDKVYILDRKRGDVVALSEDFNTMKYICRHGEAPNETVWPFTFNVWNDTVYIVDFGTKSMKMYYQGKFSGSFLLSNANENRFCLNDSLIYLSATTDSSSFLLIDKCFYEKQIPLGKVIFERTPSKTIISNKKHILYNNSKGLFTIADCYPYIEQYTPTGEYVKTFDISYVPIIKDAIKEAEKYSSKEKSIYRYIYDAYLANDCIYILCSLRDFHDDYKVNTILVFSVNDNMKLISSYILPHDIYSSFCVSDTYIFAATSVTGATIEKIPLRDANK